MTDKSHLYSTDTIVLANGAISIRFDVMWWGSAVYTLTVTSTGETHPLTEGDFTTLRTAYYDAEEGCNYVNS